MLIPLIDIQNSANLYLDAQTVVPAVNVLCVDALAQELLPMVYYSWSHSNAHLGNDRLPDISSSWFNSTVFDPIFGFEEGSPPPVFEILPEAANSAININWNANRSFYILLAFENDNQTDYEFCSMTMNLRGGCSSQYSLSSIGATLTSNCLQHDMVWNQPVVLAQNDTSEKWVAVALQWAQSVGLNSGLQNVNSSLQEILGKFARFGPGNNLTQPLLVEALAVLVASTLLDSMVRAPFDGSWPYMTDTLPSPVKQPFIARVSPYYASVPESPWQNAFIAVLAAIFTISLVCLVYLLLVSAGHSKFPRWLKTDSSTKGLRKDYTEIQELFQIALYSPQPENDSPAAVATENGTLTTKTWHLCEATPGVIGRAGQHHNLHITFSGEKTRRGYSNEDHSQSPPTESYNLSRRRSTRISTQLSFEDANLD